MLEFWIGVLGSIVASCIFSLTILAYKYIKRGKRLQALESDYARLSARMSAEVMQQDKLD